MNTGIQDAFNLGWKLAGVMHGELRPERARELLRRTASGRRQPHPRHRFRLSRHPASQRAAPARDAHDRAVPHPQRTRAGFMRSTLEELRRLPGRRSISIWRRGGPRPGERVLDGGVFVRNSRQSPPSSSPGSPAAKPGHLLLFSGLHPRSPTNKAERAARPRRRSHRSAFWIEDRNIRLFDCRASGPFDSEFSGATNFLDVLHRSA